MCLSVSLVVAVDRQRLGSALDHVVTQNVPASLWLASELSSVIKGSGRLA
jgi:hypothetical protein